MTNQFSVFHESNESFFAPESGESGLTAAIRLRPVIQKPPNSVQTTSIQAGGPKLAFPHQVAFKIAVIPEVQAVFTTDYGRVFFVWVIVPTRDPDLYKRIFDIEKSLIDEHPAVHFDFTIMPSGDENPRTLVTDRQARLVYARD